MAKKQQQKSGGAWKGFVGLAVFAVAASQSGHVASHVASAHTTASAAVPMPAAAKVIGFARAQEGKPYLYGATGPDAWDCSALAEAAYAAAGLSILRTSEAQWATMQHVSSPQPGDLVFFKGSPIDAPPGHVAIYVGPHTVIDAYGSGTVVREESYGLPSSAPGLQVPTGYADVGGQ